MHFFFHQRSGESPPAAEPVATVFPQITGAEIAASFAGGRVAGDFYDAVRVSPERVLFGLLDLTGGQEEARPLLSVAQNAFRTLGSELFSRADINESDAMAELCLRINRDLIEASAAVNSCPAFIGCYHEKFGTLCYTNAGHTPGLLRDKTGITELGSTGLPLGLFSHATSDAPIVALEKGSLVLLVSRGVVESRDHDKVTAEFGLERVKELLRQAPSAGAQALCNSLLNAVSDFYKESPLHDDRTALALIRTA